MEVVIDNLKGSVIGIFPSESDAKKMLQVLGNERIDNEFARFAYETWTWEEVVAWQKDPTNMGLGGKQLIANNPFPFAAN